MIMTMTAIMNYHRPYIKKKLIVYLLNVFVIIATISAKIHNNSIVFIAIAWYVSKNSKSKLTYQNVQCIQEFKFCNLFVCDFNIFNLKKTNNYMKSTYYEYNTLKDSRAILIDFLKILIDPVLTPLTQNDKHISNYSEEFHEEFTENDEKFHEDDNDK
ncbi:hypothetical protein RFI_07651 [Reticulomyxa filosa]|uniref:Uncharacterized protein n=1 Tax=Reticulomyxa filosa TaxID=46433 RepID=X6NUL0_RETFI|nr:hypothetical protein RFI_07651 [Reticulomyxa filosa]|eukprot:ETO29469.1 hypothetical protein RFI_07651 [Reticulomyxa filosa]